jgi:tetratricopeptide (TPR) repeat protein
MELTELLAETRKLILTAQFKEALKLLKKYSEFIDTPEVFQVSGEIYLELGKVDKAFDKFSRALELDPEGEKGAEKFLYLGQIIGGTKGIELIDRGILVLSKDASNTKKLNQSIFAQIEIWMTDLCMLPEAEAKCNELIEQSLRLDDQNPESWSLLANIRISQQRDDDAIEAIEKSWSLFKEKKETLEHDSGFNNEYLELVQPLITLAKIALELGLYEQSMEILTNIHDIDEDNAECYYLEGFTNYLYIKKTQYFQRNQEFNPDLFEQFTLQGVKGFEENAALAKLAFEKVQKISQFQDFDPEILIQTEELLQQLQGVQVQLEDDAINEDNWEDVIEDQ